MELTQEQLGQIMAWVAGSTSAVISLFFSLNRLLHKLKFHSNAADTLKATKVVMREQEDLISEIKRNLSDERMLLDKILVHHDEMYRNVLEIKIVINQILNKRD